MNLAQQPSSTEVSPTQAFYDRISPAYDLISDASEHHAREAGLRALAVQRGDVVLEIGFGTGHGLVALARAVGPSGHVCGVDLSPGMLEVARRRLADAGLGPDVDATVGDARRLPYADHRFAAVFMGFTLELFDTKDIAQVLAEVRRVLCPGGRLVVVSLLQEPNPPVAAEIYTWLHRHFPHFIDCQPIDVVTVVRRAGFAAQLVERLSIWGLPVAVVKGGKPLPGA